MDAQWFVTTPIAHRGLHGENIPENSIAAFLAAQEAGYAIELDVRLIKGGSIAVFHDETLARMTGLNGFTSDLEATSLKNVPLFGAGQMIPLLESVFERITAPIYIDVKRSSESDYLLEKRLLALIRHFKPTVAVASFDPKTLIWFRQNAPDIPRGIISCSFKGEDRSAWQKYRLRRLFDLRAVKPAFISYELNSLPFWRVTIARKLHKIPVLAWTVKNEEDLQKAGKVADNIVFEGFKP
ncbi:MAG: hypothetical protein LBO72_06550 [Helicobacteraceae bacterium]|jgi:glycerophosphoryl diester phosphodiesterase|nr:hypothetical protein [Helicobacteraceae bacterium]